MKIIGKVMLFFIWLALCLLRIPVHLGVKLLAIAHGFGTVFFGLVALLAAAFGMWQNTILFVIVIAVSFTIVFAGSFVDVLLEEICKGVGRLIVKQQDFEE